MAHFLRQTKIILIIDAVILAVCIFGIYRAVNKAGIPAEFIYNKDRVQFVSFKSTGNLSSLQNNDIFLAINNLEILKIEDIEFVCDGYNIGDTVSVRILRNGQTMDITLMLQKFYAATFIVIISILGGLWMQQTVCVCGE